MKHRKWPLRQGKLAFLTFKKVVSGHIREGGLETQVQYIVKTIGVKKCGHT